MILVDLYVPSLSNSYECRIDETVPIANVIENVTELICQKEHCEFKGNIDNLCLYTYRLEAGMSKSSSLNDNGIKDGEKLILV